MQPSWATIRLHQRSRAGAVITELEKGTTKEAVLLPEMEEWRDVNHSKVHNRHEEAAQEEGECEREVAGRDSNAGRTVQPSSGEGSDTNRAFEVRDISH